MTGRTVKVLKFSSVVNNILLYLGLGLEREERERNRI